MLIEEESGRILGAHLLGHHSEEAINLFALAIRAGLPADELRRSRGRIDPGLRHRLHGVR